MEACPTDSRISGYTAWRKTHRIDHVFSALFSFLPIRGVVGLLQIVPG